ncbi:AQP [Enterospora canceri]|uniref:Aquaporin n=1 Tax=Enterospora canceri TaxID=1081671 RepID=A0A1Y1S5Q0_9MICR|nr:AQP [Enterospora canceri]
MNIRTKLTCQKLFAEFLCSLIFGFAVYSAVLNTKASENPAPSTAVGLTVAFSSIALIYTFCDHCASHFNPAITIAALVTGKLDLALGIGYVIAQLLGFFIASLLAVLCFPYGYSKTLDLITPGAVVYSAVLNTKASENPAPSTAVGLTVAFSSIALIYTFCDHCASHFNPAITIAALVTGKLDLALGIGYVIAQLLGFFIASLLAVLCFPYGYSKTLDLITPGAVSDEISDHNIFWAEFILSFILVFVAFEVGINAVREPGVTLFVGETQIDRSKFAPLTIGSTLGFLAFLASSTSGGAFNPGIVFGPSIAGGNFEYFWQFVVAELCGGLLGGLVQVFLLFK